MSGQQSLLASIAWHGRVWGDSLLFGVSSAVLVLDSGTRLDTWRAVPVQTDPGYWRKVVGAGRDELPVASEPAASNIAPTWLGRSPSFPLMGRATFLVVTRKDTS